MARWRERQHAASRSVLLFLLAVSAAAPHSQASSRDGGEAETRLDSVPGAHDGRGVTVAEAATVLAADDVLRASPTGPQDAAGPHSAADPYSIVHTASGGEGDSAAANALLPSGNAALVHEDLPAQRGSEEPVIARHSSAEEPEAAGGAVHTTQPALSEDATLAGAPHETARGPQGEATAAAPPPPPTGGTPPHAPSVGHGKTAHQVDSSSDTDDGRSAERLINLAAAADGATVVAANKDARKPEKTIDNDDDSYMKNLCSADKWIILELSQLGRVDEVELVNKEMYSSRVKEFSVRGRQSHPRKDGPPVDWPRWFAADAWQPLGTFTAANRKGAQRFRMPVTKRVRYLLLQFHTHYGSEEVCALNGLAVWGVSAAQELEEALALHLDLPHSGPGRPAAGEWAEAGSKPADEASHAGEHHHPAPPDTTAVIAGGYSADAQPQHIAEHSGMAGAADTEHAPALDGPRRKDDIGGQHTVHHANHHSLPLDNGEGGAAPPPYQHTLKQDRLQGGGTAASPPGHGPRALGGAEGAAAAHGGVGVASIGHDIADASARTDRDAGGDADVVPDVWDDPDADVSDPGAAAEGLPSPLGDAPPAADARHFDSHVRAGHPGGTSPLVEGSVLAGSSQRGRVVLVPPPGPLPSLIGEGGLFAAMEGGPAAKPKQAGNLFDVFKQEFLSLRMNQTRMWHYMSGVVEVINAGSAQAGDRVAALEQEAAAVRAHLASLPAQMEAVLLARASRGCSQQVRQLAADVAALRQQVQQAQQREWAFLLYSACLAALLYGVAVWSHTGKAGAGKATPGRSGAGFTRMVLALGTVNGAMALVLSSPRLQRAIAALMRRHHPGLFA